MKLGEFKVTSGAVRRSLSLKPGKKTLSRVESMQSVHLNQESVGQPYKLGTTTSKSLPKNKVATRTR